MKGAFDVLVLGAGPAGLAAAIASARGGHPVIILEKNDRPGKKLLLTGGGRCNLVDPNAPAVAALDAYGKSGRSLRQALAAFDLAAFLAGLGVETERDSADGPVFVRGGARRMLDALLAEAARLNVEIIAGAAATSARKTEAGGFEVETARGSFAATKRLVIAAGGMTYPATGSSGDGYALAEGFGHAVEPPRPGLGALATSPCFPELAGLGVPEARLALKAGSKRLAERSGALLFTHRGVSGPAALDLSLDLARLGALSGTALLADLAPDSSREQILDALVARSRAETKRTLENSGLEGLPVPARLGVELARRAGLDPRRRMGQFSRQELGALAGTVKSLSLTVAGLPAPEEAMVTVGGVATKDLDPRTMASRLVPGLRFAGEVLAPAGPCGGYNLLLAFATGSAAGNTKAEG